MSKAITELVKSVDKTLNEKQGAIINAQTLLSRLRHMYDFECEAGPLYNCWEFIELERCIESLANE